MIGIQFKKKEFNILYLRVLKIILYIFITIYTYVYIINYYILYLSKSSTEYRLYN